jgi:hypothetical protein
MQHVAVAANIAGNPATPRIVALLDTYFTVINRHDYQGLIALFSQQEQQEISAGPFINGFLSTTDSGETLVGISTDAIGRTVAMVTFTSHQRPAESVNHSQACTIWRISLFLERHGQGYLIGKPPAGYAASYAPCP